MGQRCSSCSSSAAAGPPHQPPDQETTKLVDDAVVAQTKPAAAEKEGTVIGRVEASPKPTPAPAPTPAQRKAPVVGGVELTEVPEADVSSVEVNDDDMDDPELAAELAALDGELADGGVTAQQKSSTEECKSAAVAAEEPHIDDVEEELGDAGTLDEIPVEWTVKQLVEGIFASWENRVLQLQEASGKMRLCGPRRPDGNAGAVIEGTENQLYGCTVSVLKKPRNHNGPCSEDQSAFRLQLADGTTFKMVPVPDTRSHDDVLERTNTVWHSGKHGQLKQMLEHLSKKVVPETSIEISANS